MLCAFVFKIDLQTDEADERISLKNYDRALVVSGLFCVPIAGIAAVVQKLYRAYQLEFDTDEHQTANVNLEFRRHFEGIATADDVAD